MKIQWQYWHCVYASTWHCGRKFISWHITTKTQENSPNVQARCWCAHTKAFLWSKVEYEQPAVSSSSTIWGTKELNIANLIFTKRLWWVCLKQLYDHLMSILGEECKGSIELKLVWNGFCVDRNPLEQHLCIWDKNFLQCLPNFYRRFHTYINGGIWLLLVEGHAGEFCCMNKTLTTKVWVVFWEWKTKPWLVSIFFFQSVPIPKIVQFQKRSIRHLKLLLQHTSFLQSAVPLMPNTTR